MVPRKKPVPSNSEIRLLTQAWRYIDFLLVKQLLFGITNSMTERSMKDFDRTLKKIVPGFKKIVPGLDLSEPNCYFDSDLNLDHEFFQALDHLLKKLGENTNPALRIVHWRAKTLRRHLKGFSEMFPAAK